MLPCRTADPAQAARAAGVCLFRSSPLRQALPLAEGIVLSLARFNRILGIDPVSFDKNDVHLHVPAGALPKDGPSAGITMCTALVSALTGRRVRRDVAMTGEITLRGKVLPVGGIKEKLLAAHRGGIQTVIIPEENERDLVEIPKNIKQNLDIRPVRWIDEVLEIALADRPKPRVQQGETEVASSSDAISTMPTTSMPPSTRSVDTERGTPTWPAP